MIIFHFDDGDDDSLMDAALCRVLQDCLHSPDKKKDFIREGTLQLLLELCNSNKTPRVKAYAASTMAVLCHQNSTAKAEIVEQGGSRALLSLCRPLGDSNCDGVSTKMDRLLAHEQSAAVLQKLTYDQTSCQADLVNAGIVRHLVQLCDVFNPDGDHGNCCQVTNSYSKQANEVFSDLTMNKKLIGNVSELSGKESVRKMESFIQSGADIHCVGEEINKIYSVDLYDTTTTKDIRISNELTTKGLVWPDMSCLDDLNKNEQKQSPTKEAKSSSTWCDINLMHVVDAGHFWAHIGGEAVKKNVDEIQNYLRTQEFDHLLDIPGPGSLVCAQETISGHKMLYRARVLEVFSSGETSKTKVFAIDFGFTATIPGDMVYTMPESLNNYPPQAYLCCLPGVQAPPKHTAVLEYVAGSLRNLSEVNEDFVSYIATSGGIEALLKLCFIPSKGILVQALAALSNLALDIRFKARIGFLGGIKILLNLCLQYEHDEDILMYAVGAIQSVLVNSVINRSRALDAHGLQILVHVYLGTKKEELKNRTLRATKNLIGRQNGEAVPEASTNRNKNPLDLTSVMDRCPTTQTKFSLSVAPDADDGYTHRFNNQRSPRTRARTRKGLVDPKPTQVSLSLDLLEKTTTSNPSDTESDDSDDCYSGRWTSENDTDGEMLIKDKSTTKIPNRIALAESLSSDKYYVQTHYMAFKEDESHEFSSQTNVYDISKRKIAKSLCAFLNNKKCGTIYIGVRGSGEISGVRVRRKERDLLRVGLDEMIGSFKPPLKHDMYQIDFIPIARPAGCESVVTRKLIEDRFVIEIVLLKYTGFIYTTPQGKCYFRHKSANIELTTQEVREKTIQEEEASYNEEIKRLRKELKGMRKQLSERTRGTENATNYSSDSGKEKLVIPKTTPEQRSSTNEFNSQDHDVQASGCMVM